MTDVLLSHKGIISATDEEFVHTLVVQTAESDLQAIATDAATAFQSAWIAGGAVLHNIFGNTVDYVGVTAAEILNLVDPTLSAGVTAEFVAPAPSGGGTTGALQVALAVSLVAGQRPNGTPLRGRFYLPTLAASAVGNGVLVGANRQNVADFVSEWLTGLIAQGHQPGVWSRVNNKLPSGFINALTGGRVGNVPDTIRSRRNGLPEAPYSDLVLV